jgi:hypothetical protein
MGSCARWPVDPVLRAAHHHPIPDGSYFLHADDGRVHQLKSVDGQWQYLAII